MRDAFDDVHAVRDELARLVRVVREQAHGANAERTQDRSGNAVVALVVAKAEGEIGVDRVEPVLLLQRVRADLVGEPDPAPFLAQVEHDPPRLRAHVGETELELIAAIAAERAERVAGEALRVEAHRDVVGSPHVAADDREVLAIVVVVGEDQHAKVAEARRKVRRSFDTHARRQGRSFGFHFSVLHSGRSTVSMT